MSFQLRGRRGVKVAKNGQKIKSTEYPYRLTVTLAFLEGERPFPASNRTVLVAHGKSVEALSEFAATYVPRQFPDYVRYAIEDAKHEVVANTQRQY